MSITITGPKSLTLPSALGGDDTIYALTVVCSTRGLIVEDSPGADTVRIRGIKDTTLVTLDIVKLLLSKNAEVDDYPVFFQIDDITRLCPFAPDDLTDEDGDPIPQETWETYAISGGHAPKQINDTGDYYRENVVGGKHLAASLWGSWIASPPTGIQVITPAAYRALQPSNGV